MGLQTLAFRQHRRVVTAPPTVKRTEESQGWLAVQDLQPPDTAAVRRDLELGGPATTLGDLALGIVGRLLVLDAPGIDAEEVLFLRDCIKAGSSKTAMPCGLISESASVGAEGDVQSWLLRTYGQGDDTPTSTVSHAALSSRSVVSCKNVSRRTSRHPSFALSELAGSPSDEPDFPEELPAADAPEVQELLEDQFSEWSLDVFALAEATEGRALQLVGWEALRRGCFFSEFNIDPQKAHCFLQNIESKYRDAKDVPYHNSLHAADVTQTVHTLLWTMGFKPYFEHLSVLSMILSAIVHDVGHDGRTNNFHTNVQDDLALTYNDRSILENFHASQAFKLMTGQPDADLICDLSKDQRTQLRKEMVEMILGTDMAHHFRQVETFKGYVQQLGHDPADWLSEPAAVSALQTMIIHGADIATPAKPWGRSERWTALLQQEFFMQGDAERTLGLPISPLCDRYNSKVAQSQIGFIKFIVRPTYELLASVSPVLEDTVLKELSANLALWEGRKMQEDLAEQPGQTDDLAAAPGA
uniref:Phosphodiesterase n=1 Tax=Zooxanthella nutricula TaxID=1333877 RepID=A0A6U9EZY5_9DINO|mmetsp:Transcript_92600/g.283595  ORF Transcript_92600/g.283595 Transcript_92600/m.283595 type:complete len:528 (+) Transcript_92600:178-1761(+)